MSDPIYTLPCPVTLLERWRNELHYLPTRFEFCGKILLTLLPRIDTPGVIERVSTLFQGNPGLIQGFNTFLPPGYKIEISNDPRNLSGITVTTPQGILQQPGHLGGPLRIPREPSGLHNTFPPQPFAAPPVLPVGLGPGSRPATPMMHTIPQHLPGYTDPVRPYSPNVQANIQAAAAANLLGRRPEERTQVEFNHAIQFLNKIKVRFSDEPETYKQFLEILQNYQKESRQIQDVSGLDSSHNHTIQHNRHNSKRMSIRKWLSSSRTHPIS